MFDEIVFETLKELLGTNKAVRCVRPDRYHDVTVVTRIVCVYGVRRVCL
jgi:hypothetical protein